MDSAWRSSARRVASCRTPRHAGPIPGANCSPSSGRRPDRMSRIGKLSGQVPSGVTGNTASANVSVKGPKGELSRKFPDGISFTLEDNKVLAPRANDEARQKALHGLSRALIANMVEGVTKGYSKQLEITGV